MDNRINKHGLASAKVRGWIHVFMNNKQLEPVYFVSRNDRQIKLANIYLMIDNAFYDNTWDIRIKIDEWMKVI